MMLFNVFKNRFLRRVAIGLSSFLVAIVIIFFINATNSSFETKTNHQDTAENESLIGGNAINAGNIDNGFDVDIHMRDLNLWQYDKDAKHYNADENNTLDIDDQYYANINSGELGSLETGDAVILTAADGEEVEVVLAYDNFVSKNNDQDNNQLSREWLLTNRAGDSIGRFAVFLNGIEGEFSSESGEEFFFQSENNAVWVIPKKELEIIINESIVPDPSLASVGNPSHPDYGWREMSFDPDIPNDDHISPEYTYDGSDNF